VKTLVVIPILVFLLQLYSFAQVYISYESQHAHIPSAFVELNILVAFNILFLLMVYLFSKKQAITIFWLLPIVFSLLIISMLLFAYILIGLGFL